MFLQFRAMNSNFDVLVLSIFFGDTKVVNVLRIVPIGVLQIRGPELHMP